MNKQSVGSDTILMNLIKLLSSDRASANEYIENIHTVIHIHIFVYVFLDDLPYHLRLL